MRVVDTPNEPNGATPTISSWSTRDKMTQLSPLFFLGSLTAVNVVSIGPSEEAGVRYFDVSTIQYLLSNTGFFGMMAVGPMFLAPLSETLGRRPVFLVALGAYSLTFIPSSLVRLYPLWACVRTVSELGASVVNTMVPGSITDLYSPEHTSQIMSFYILSLFAGQSVGQVAVGWMCERLRYPWVWGAQGIVTAVGTSIYICVGKETRAPYLLGQRNQLASSVGLRTSLTRPFTFLTLEPIVTALSLWLGFALGLIFLFTSSVLAAYRTYDFRIAVGASIEVTLLIGACLGCTLANVVGSRQHGTRSCEPSEVLEPERHLVVGCVGGLALAIGIMGFGWTVNPSIPWIISAIFLTIVYFGVFSVFQAVCCYIAAAYGQYSSSAQASQSFVRNIMAGVLPLAANPLFHRLDIGSACSVLGCIAFVFAGIPFVLYFYG